MSLRSCVNDLDRSSLLPWEPIGVARIVYPTAGFNALDALSL
jgi:hypothetical protein